MKLLLCLAVIMLTGCATSDWRTYSEFSVGYEIDQEVGTNSVERCRYPFTAAIGVETAKTSIALEHSSHLDCGQPFDKKADVSTNKIVFKRRVYLFGRDN